jgi:hypothetical protein
MTTTVTSVRSSTNRSSTNRSSLIASVLLDVVLPVGIFYALRGVGADQWWSLLLSATVPAGVAVGRFVRRRVVDWGAVFVVSLVALGLVLAALTGDPRTLLIRDAWLGLVGGAAGAWLLGSVFYGRPATIVMFRAMLMAQKGPERVRAWEARWDVEPDFRRHLRVITVVWGVALLLNAVAQLVAAYALPLDLAPGVMHFIWPVILAPLMITHFWYTKRHDLRA